MEKIPNEVYERVRSAYLKQIRVPGTKPQRQYILCPVGLVGAGKTTVIKPLAEKLNLVRISGDEIRKVFKEEGFGYDRVRELMFVLVESFLEKGFSVAIDSDCASEESREHIKEAEERSGAKALWIHINPPEAFILRKLKHLTPNWLGTAEAMIENYYRRKPLHELLDLPFLYTFDTSRGDLDRQIEEAVSTITESLKE